MSSPEIINPHSNRLIDIASRDVVCLGPSSGVGEAARIMAERRFSSIVVADEARQPLGIVTERNILHAMRSGLPLETPLHACMSSPVVAVNSTMDTLEAYQRCLAEGIRHLVLLDEAGAIAGVVSETDFRKHLNLTALAGRCQVISMAQQTVCSLPPHSSLMQALKLMQSQRETCVIVVEDGRPVGIITERDVVRFYADDLPRSDIQLRDAMVSPVLSIVGNATVNAAAELMLQSGVRHLAVIDEEGRLVGLLSEHDLTRTMAHGLLNERLEVDEAFLRTFIDTIPDLAWLKNQDGVYLACNRRFEQFFGAKEKDIVGKTDYDFVEKEMADFFREHDRKAMLAERPTRNEEWLSFADDNYHGLFETIKTPMRDSRGKLIGVLGVARDVTEREHIKRELTASEQEFRTLAENLPDNLVRYDSDCRVRYVNPAMVHSVAAELRPVVGESPCESFPGNKDVEAYQRLLEQVIATGVSAETGIQVPHPDGSPHFHHVVFVAERSPTGDITGALAIGRDISERKHSEDVLVESERKFRTLTENLPDNIIRYGRDCRVLYMNPAMVRTIAPGFLPILGKQPVASDPASERIRALQGLVEQVMDSGRRVEIEQEIPHPDGTLHWHHVIFVPECDEDGKVTGALGIGRDISERKLAEAALSRSEYRYRTLIENSPFCIHEIDLEGRLQSMNRAGLSMLGREKEAQVCGVKMLDLVSEEDKARIDALLRDALQGKASHFEFVPVLEPPRYFKSCFIPILGPNGKVQELMGLTEDITERKRADEALRRSLEDYSDLVQSIPVGVYKYRTRADGSARFDYVSKRWCELLDVDEAEVMRDPDVAWQRIHPDELEHFTRVNEEAGREMRRFEWEGRIRRQDGEERWLHIESQPARQANGDIVWEGIQYDTTDRRRAEEVLRINASVFDNSREAIIITDAENRIIDVNPAFTRITGYSRDEVLGRNPNLLGSGRQDVVFYRAMWAALQQEGAWRGEIWNRRKNGEVYAELLSISAICDEAGRVQRYVGVFADITYFKDHEAELNHVANYDALTGVPNRRLLGDRMAQAIVHAHRTSGILAVCYLDLDGFKAINDQYGHEVGDQLLVATTRRLQSVLRAGDTLARLGGDEFVMLFNDLEEEVECFQVLERVVQTIALPVEVEGHLLTISASVGVTFYPSDEQDGDTLLRHADQAMYIAKQSGKNRYHLYDPVHDQRVRTLYESRKRIQLGLDAREFELYFQPILELASGRVVGVEALIRWHHPERGLLLPGEFLPALENSDLEIRLGNWVIDTALAQMLAWQKQGLDIEVNINISARHLQSPEFVQVLQGKLSHHAGLRPGRLQIEVLETAALEDIAQTSDIIEACRVLGVSFALDDFGTGYSSLAYLRRLSADTLKIDQSFVKGMLQDEGDRAIVQGVIALAKSFGRKTVAEGLEDAGLVQVLAGMGCEYGQGYGIAHPMPAKDFIDWIHCQPGT